MKMHKRILLLILLASMLISSTFLASSVHAYSLPVGGGEGSPPPTPGAPVYFSVEPVAVDPLINVNTSINGLEVPLSTSAVGQNFTVDIHLRNATTTNVPAGVTAVYVDFDFVNILNYCKVTGFTSMLGQSGGVLNGEVTYGLNGFYDIDGAQVDPTNYAQATQYAVAAVSTSSWNNDDGTVARITFQITEQPSQTPSQSTFYDLLPITCAELLYSNGNKAGEIPYDVVQGTLRIDGQNPPQNPIQYPPPLRNPPPWNPPPQQPIPQNPPAPQQPQVYFSVEPVAVAPLINVNASVNGLEVSSSTYAVGQNFTVDIHLRNATVTNVPAGVVAVEVHFDFGNILNYCMPIGFTTMLGQSGGALVGPLLCVYNGFYDANGNAVDLGNYAQATQYIVAAASTSSWNNDDGLVAQITFQITGQPSKALNQSTFYSQLPITYAELIDYNRQEIAYNIVQSTLRIDDPIRIPGDINGDGKVNLADLVIFAEAYASKPGDPNWNPAADFLGQGKVDLADLVVLAEHYGQHYP